MCNSLSTCVASAPPIDPDFHRRVRLRRLGLQGATARLVAELAYGLAGRGDLTALASITASRCGATAEVR